MRIAIHQPNFLPWLGIFHRMFLADTFVFFDHVQAMGGKSWLSRNKILVGGKDMWLTLPVKKAGRLGQKITDVEINYDTNFLSKHLQTIEMNYKKTEYFYEFFPILAEIYENKPRLICDFNKRFITEVCKFIGLSCKFVSSSDLLHSHVNLGVLSGNDLVLEICRCLKAQEYVSGTGCLDFIEPDTFLEEGINFYFQDFVHPIYKQYRAPSFISHLSVIDALFCVGRKQTLEMISQNTLLDP